MGTCCFMLIGVTVSERMAAKVGTDGEVQFLIATLNMHCLASFDTMNFVLHHVTDKLVLYGHMLFHADRSNGFRENGCQSWNRWRSAIPDSNFEHALFGQF